MENNCRFCAFIYKLGMFLDSFTQNCNMKWFFALLLPMFVLFSSFGSITSIDDVVGALKAGNAERLSAFFDNTVEITTPDKSNNYSKSQATVIVKDFFNINGVKDFEVVHKGENDGSQYCIGTLKTKAGDFRTTIFMKQKGLSQ